MTALLSLFVPGLGQMCQGKVLRGIAWFFIVIVGYACFVIPGLVLHIMCVVNAYEQRTPDRIHLS